MSARLPSLLAGLAVVTEEMPLSAPLAAPEPEDLRATGGMAEKRRHEYLAGRQCARLALARLGIHGHVLRAGGDRAPIWPAGVVGSITHAGAAPDGFCGVAVARQADLAALGIDAEIDRPLPDELRAGVLTAPEREALARWPAEARGRIATIYFSAKESVYKALAPLLGVFLEFDDVTLDLQLGGGGDGSARQGQFTVDVAAAPAPPLAGRILVAPGFVLTAAFAPTAPYRAS